MSTYHARYLASGMRADGFLPSGFGDAESRRRRVLTASQRRVSPELLAVLRGPERHLETLRGPSAVVVTGQQVGLFLGPLYTIYKAASAISLARALTAETGVACVPLFWLQTEDHDFAEIAHCTEMGSSVVELRLDDDGRRLSVGGRVLPDQIDSMLSSLDDALAARPFGRDVTALLRAHYRRGASLAGAFAGLLAALFPDLVILDPRQPAVARLAMPVLRTALLKWAEIDAVLAARGKALDDAGLDQQIRLRPGSPLVFYHPHDALGDRHRLTASDGNFRCPDATESLPSLLATLEADPMRFSTSALLRPILQDSLLPTAAYVGGAAEVSYFAQLAPLYPLFGLEAPMVVPRARFRIIPPAAQRLLESLGTSLEDFENHPPSDDNAVSASWLMELEQRLDGLGPELGRAVAKTRFTVRRAVEKLRRRQEHISSEHRDTVAGRTARLRQWLEPNGVPQERVYGFAGFAALTGIEPFMQTVLASVHPFDPTLRDIRL